MSVTNGNGHHRTLAELAAEAGLPTRTIRYYIARGLLPGPDTAGRAAEYGPVHLERLTRIREAQRCGMTLAEIAGELGGGDVTPSPDPVPCWRCPVDDGVEVLVRGDLPPWRLRHIRRAIAEMAAHLKAAEPEPDDVCAPSGNLPG